MRKSILAPLLLTLAALPATSCYFHIGGSGPGEYYVPSADPNTARDLRSENRARIERLQLGMTVDQVKEIMGASSTWLNEAIGWVSNPYRSESFVDKDGQTVLVLYYYTRINQSDNLITDDELTPIGFRDGKLVGWGQSYLENAKVAR